MHQVNPKTEWAGQGKPAFQAFLQLLPTTLMQPRSAFSAPVYDETPLLIIEASGIRALAICRDCHNSATAYARRRQHHMHVTTNIPSDKARHGAN
jgi:hypothetical protein